MAFLNKIQELLNNLPENFKFDGKRLEFKCIDF